MSARLRGLGRGFRVGVALRIHRLAEAEAQLGSREEAMRMLGEETQVKNRNHNRAWRRELALARQRCLARGEAPPAGLRDG